MNVSSVVWSRARLSDALNRLFDEVVAYRLVGDWRLYLEVLAQQDAELVYACEALNIHRRHSESVTHSIDPELHIEEISTIHNKVKSLIDVSETVNEDMSAYIAELRQQFDIDSVTQAEKGQQNGTKAA